MRIGLVAPPWVPVPPIRYGGTEAVIDVLARGLAALGHEVRLFATGDSTCPVPRASVFDVPPAPMGTTMPEVRHVLAAYDALADCDVVHDHTLVGPLVAGRHPGVAVATNHAPFDEQTTPLYRVAAERVGIVAISHAQRSEAPDVPVVRVIHHGLDLDRYPEGPGGGGYLLFLGRIAPEKGVHRAIEIARLAGVPLVIAAKMREEREHRYFEDLVRPQLGVGVTYVGEVGNDEKVQLLQGALALVNPIGWPEPFGLVMAEALACGTPVLAFPRGAAPEIVDDGVTGFLRTDVAGLAQAVGELDDIVRAACRKAVTERFSADRMVRDYADLFADLLASGPVTGP